MLGQNMEQVPDETAQLKEAETYISEIMSEVSSMGGNDSEIPVLNRLIQSLRSGQVSPEEAKKEAYEIFSRKQDYH
jgi:uncharacterized membrane protein YjjP (DUF1212 family)